MKFQLPVEMKAEQRNVYELTLAAYDRFSHDLRSRLFFIESLQKWPKTPAMNDDDEADFDDENSSRGPQ